MFARSLQEHLSYTYQKADFGSEARDGFERRFKSLRDCALLPRGREHRNAHLTADQVANAVLGSTAIQPGWAGFTAIGLAQLAPVGGSSEPFTGAVNILGVVKLLIADDEMRRRLVTLTLSSAEGGVNSHHYAMAVYTKDDGSMGVTSFVPKNAFSLFQPGAEVSYPHFRRYSPVSHETSLSRSFFEELARKLEQSKLFSQPPGAGEEYDDEEAEKRRRDRLGVRAGSNYLNIGVDTHVTWPAEETLVRCGSYELVLMPRTKDRACSVHIDLVHNRLSSEDAVTVINRFLSLMAWVDDHYAVAQEGWSGNPIPVAVPKRELAFVTAYGWFFDRSIPVSNESRVGLALYREARNAQENFLVSAAVLNFYRILELRYPNGRDTRAFIATRFPIVAATSNKEDVDRFNSGRGGIEPEKYIYDAYRLAVSHASPRTPSDPDESVELSRLHIGAQMLRWLARDFIANTLGVPDQRVD